MRSVMVRCSGEEKDFLTAWIREMMLVADGSLASHFLRSFFCLAVKRCVPASRGGEPVALRLRCVLLRLRALVVDILSCLAFLRAARSARIWRVARSLAVAFLESWMLVFMV